MPGETRGMRSSFEDAWRRRFVERGSRFRDEAEVAGWSRTGLATRFRRFQELWPGAAAGEIWLDAGCGAGTYTRYLRSQGVHVLGLDYSAPSLAKARTLDDESGWWVAGDVKRLPLVPESVDGVLCFGVMQALDDPQPALEAMMTTVRSGGSCWVDGLNRWFLPTLAREFVRVVRGRPRHLRYDGPWALQRAMRTAGGSRVSVHWLPLAPARFPRLRKWFEHSMTKRVFRWCPPLGLLCSHSFILVARKPA